MKIPEKFEVVKPIGEEERERLRLLKRYRCYILTDGKMIIWRVDRGKIIWPKYQDVKSAISAQRHIIKKYNNEEIQSLRKITRITQEVKRAILNWNEGKEKVESLQKQLEEAVSLLSLCREKNKVEALKFLRTSKSISDSLGRKNPGMVATCLTATGERTEKRQKVARYISDTFINQRLDILILEERQMLANLSLAAIRLKTLSVSPESFFTESLYFLNIELGKTLYLLQSIWLAPYKKTADQAKEHLLKAKEITSKPKVTPLEIGEIKRSLLFAFNAIVL